jgi:hypothetical protein
MTHNIFKPIDRQDVEEEGSEPDRGSCDFCQTAITEDEEERRVGGGDEYLTMCESCASNYLE